MFFWSKRINYYFFVGQPLWGQMVWQLYYIAIFLPSNNGKLMFYWSFPLSFLWFKTTKKLQTKKGFLWGENKSIRKPLLSLQYVWVSGMNKDVQKIHYKHIFLKALMKFPHRAQTMNRVCFKLRIVHIFSIELQCCLL